MCPDKRRQKKGDVATIVEHHPISDEEDGYSLELFNALGDTIAVITLPESAIEPLTKECDFQCSFIGNSIID